MIGAPDRKRAVRLIKEATNAGARTGSACREMGISMRTFQRWTQEVDVRIDGRPGAARPAPDSKLTIQERQAVLDTVNSPVYRSLPPSQIVPALADEGRYIASESTFYRILREEGQQKHRGRSRTRKNRPLSTHCATGSNQVWCWDITWLPGPAKGVYYYLYLILDLYSRKVVGWEIHEEESSERAAQLLRRAYLRENIGGVPLVLHSDNGSPMKGATLLATLHALGVIPSFSRPSVSNDNPYSESLFRTLKYRPEYPEEVFDDLHGARTWVRWFVDWYNNEHLHSSINFVTPAQRHAGHHVDILAQREQVYRHAKSRHPQRWSGNIRNWDPVGDVHLNPAKDTTEFKKNKAA